MSAGHLEQCRSCRTQIVWVTTDRGKAMPVNAFPDPERGNIALSVERGKTRAVVVPKTKAAAMRAANVNLHLAHFATCPDANLRRKAR